MLFQQNNSSTFCPRVHNLSSLKFLDTSEISDMGSISLSVPIKHVWLLPHHMCQYHTYISCSRSLLLVILQLGAICDYIFTIVACIVPSAARKRVSRVGDPYRVPANFSMLDDISQQHFQEIGIAVRLQRVTNGLGNNL